jgi:hypothetical protein
MTRWLALLLLAAPAHAELRPMPRPGCPPFAELAAEFGVRYGEVPLLAAEPDEGLPFLMIGNAETGTWSMLFIEPDGRSCKHIFGRGLAIAKPGEPT